MAELSNVEKLRLEREEKNKELALEKATFTYDKIAEMTEFKTDLIAILHKTVAKGTSPSELAYFLNYCNSIGLNPLNKEIWCYKDNSGNLIMFTGRDGFLKKAHESPRYKGMRSSDVCEKDDFEIDMVEGKVKHKFGTGERGKPVGAYCFVFIEGREPTLKWVDFAEFNLQQALWKTKPKKMILKVAETHALKEALGITGLSSEYDFNIVNGIALGKDEKAGEIKTDDEHETVRLLELISAAKTPEKLKALLKECNLPEEIEAYDLKMKELVGE